MPHNALTIGELRTRGYADTVCHDYREPGSFCLVTDEKATPGKKV